MAPSTSSQHATTSSPLQDTTQPPKRSLRNRASNSTVTGNSAPVDGSDDHDKDGSKGHSDGGGGSIGLSDARVVNGVDHRKRKRSPSAITQELHRDRRTSKRETEEQMQFREFMNQLAVVLLEHDPTPTIIHFPLPAEESSDTPHVKRAKTESDEPRTIASKLSDNDYSSVNQIEDDLIITTKNVLSQLPVSTQPHTAVSEFFTLAQDLLLNHPSSETKPQHSLRSSIPNGTSPSTPQVPGVRPPLREALYTIGPNGPLFTSIAARDIRPVVAAKLPSYLTLPTSTGGSFTASSASIVPTNVVSTASRTLADSVRKRSNFPNRKRPDFSDDTLGKFQSTKWLDWGTHASFAPEWDDGGVGGGFGAEGISIDWAYKRLRREKRKDSQAEAPAEPMVEEPIDERLLLKWEPSSPPKDLLEGELVVDESEMNIDETLNGLRRMIYLLSQLQTLRMAAGTAEIPEREKALADNIVLTFQNLIVSYSVPPNALISSLPQEAYNIIPLSHPQYAGSLPSKNMPTWTPPAPPQPPQRAMSFQQQPRPIHGNQPPQRLAPGYPIPSRGPTTPLVRGYSAQAATPATGSSSQNWTPPLYAGGGGTYRGVGRPRKYDVRR